MEATDQSREAKEECIGKTNPKNTLSLINLILIKHYEKNRGDYTLSFRTSDSEPVILPEDYVTVTKMKHLIEVQHMQKRNSRSNIRKISNDFYVDLSTGEKKEFTHSENRQENSNSLKQTFKKIRYLINNNFEGNSNELFVTLTYAEDVKDPKRLYKDFDKFFKRLRYKYKEQTTIDYMSVVEPHESGVWHCHVLLRFNDLEKIYIPNKFDKETKQPIDAPLYDLWKQGYVKIKSINNVDNVGAYLSAYMADVELTEKNATRAMQEGREVVKKNVNGEEKKFIKGGRLSLYPPGMNLYRKSKGIQMPERTIMRHKKAKKIVGSAQPHFTNSYAVENENFQNTITYEQYNMKRIDNQNKKEQ